ncbi:MAG: Acyl-CoA thioester hydrolase YbgC [Flavobacteriales bacterium UBA4585]|nr:MAG: Acyl-CoA thioester hydrolase YbgC [Flavobacteriales bacterium UBA4585]
MKHVDIKDTHTFRPRYSETDQMGVVYYGNYAAYFEVGRVELLRKLGVSYAQLEANGTMLPVVHMSIDFKRGAKYDEEVQLETSMHELPTRKISFYHILRDMNGKTLVSGKVVLVFVDKITFKPKSCPEELARLFTNLS